MWRCRPLHCVLFCFIRFKSNRSILFSNSYFYKNLIIQYAKHTTVFGSVRGTQRWFSMLFDKNFSTNFYWNSKKKHSKFEVFSAQTQYTETFSVKTRRAKKPRSSRSHIDPKSNLELKVRNCCKSLTTCLARTYQTNHSDFPTSIFLDSDCTGPICILQVLETLQTLFWCFFI